MRFYTREHQFYCGVDLHTRSMYVCILDQRSQILLHHNMPADPDAFLSALQPYREDIVVCAECMFSWYWLADLCQRENIPFVLGHALYMRAIHGAKAKNDRIDSRKIALLLKAGLILQAYVYPRQMRATRDLLRRRNYLMRRRADLLAHIQNTNGQYNLPPFGKKIAYRAHRTVVAEQFYDPDVTMSVTAGLELIDHYGQLQILKTCLSCPSPAPEPDTNWCIPRYVAHPLTGTARGTRCVFRSRSSHCFAGFFREALNLHRGLCGTAFSHTKR